MAFGHTVSMEIFASMASAQSGKKKTSGAAKGKAKAPAKKASSARASGARKAASTEKKRTSVAPAGKKRTSAASGQRVNGQSKPKTRKRTRGIEENPLAHRSSAVLLVDGPVEPRSEVRERAPRRDRPARSPSGGGSRGRSSGRGFGAVNAFLLVIIAALLGLGVWRTMEYQALAEMKAVVGRQTYYDGTTVEGVDVSGMTLQEAIDHWDAEIEPAHRQVAAVLDDGTRITAAELGYSSNYQDVLAGAWNAGRSGSLRQRYLQLSTAGSSASYEVERTNFDDALVRQYVAAVAEAVDTVPRDAHVSGFNPDTYEFEFTQESVGYSLDQEALVNAVESALNGGGGTISRQIATIEPSITRDNVASEYGMIASAVTNASSSSSNRISNIRLAMSIISGTRLSQGETFSFNETVGERTTARGFKTATAYSSGTVTEEVGGGICQVSTTLFNAAVKADLKINERYPHSLTVSYVDLGKDAAVDWKSKDLKFTNTTGDDIYICGTVTEDKRVRFGIFGKLLPDGETITVEGVKTGEIDYETKYQVSFDLYTGQQRQIQAGKKGYKATAYKIRWDAEGNELSREELCKSSYQATPEIIEYGP